MATPEQNALLAMQLFGQPAEQFNRQNDARTNLVYKLTMAQREEQLKRDLMAEQDARAYKLADYQGQREDARARAAEGRQKNQLDALQTREDTRVAESERRQTTALDARDKADLQNEFDRLYPQYAAAQARAGLPIKQRTDFPQTRAGLGQLAADLRTAEVGFENKRFELAADASIAELEEAKGALAGARSQLEKLSEPSPEDQKYARGRAVEALKQAIENGTITSAEKLKPKAISDGLAALARGDDKVAEALLGAEAVGAFEAVFGQTLMALPNTKSRLQERAQAQQSLLAIQSQTSRIESDLRKGAAANPFLAEKLKTSRGGLQQLMTPAEPAKRKRTFEEITPPPGQEDGGVEAPTIPVRKGPPAAAAVRSPNIFQMMGYQAPSGAGPGVPPATVIAPEAPSSSPGNPLLALQSAPAPDPVTTKPMPPEVSQAAAIIANNPRGRGLEPYIALVKGWLDNNGIGRPYSQENVNLRRLTTPQPQPGY